uniref:Uncharacterized protein n=1 Tax=Oryza punctata TaxID=4537 RepID=A0A0E0K0E4_ORYPU
MASASDPAEAQLHGQREPHDSSSTDASIPAPPSAADVSPPPPPPLPSSSVEGRTKQPGGGGRGDDDASSSSEAAVEQKGKKKKISASDDREQVTAEGEEEEEERKSDSQKEKLPGSSVLAAYQGGAKKPSDDIDLARKLPWDDPRVWKPHVTPVSTIKKSLGISIFGYISNKFLRRKGSPAGFSNLNYKQQPLVQHQKIPLASAPEHYGLPSGLQGIISTNLLILLNEYSDFRPEQVLDRVGTDEEKRLLAAVAANIKPEALPIDHPGWAPGFSQSHKVFEELIKKVIRWKRRQKGAASADSRRQKLLEFFSSYSTSDDILSFLKYAASIWMCSHREEYQPLIPELGDGYTMEVVSANISLPLLVSELATILEHFILISLYLFACKQWCEIHLLQPREDTDHIQMTAVAAALGVTLLVENLHNGPAHDIYTADGVDVPRVTLLYTGAHYDILYPRHPSG